MAGEVELRRLARAELHEEGDVYVSVPAGGAGVGERALVAVLAPINGDAAAVGERNMEEREEKEEE